MPLLPRNTLRSVPFLNWPRAQGEYQLPAPGSFARLLLDEARVSVPLHRSCRWRRAAFQSLASHAAKPRPPGTRVPLSGPQSVAGRQSPKCSPRIGGESRSLAWSVNSLPELLTSWRCAAAIRLARHSLWKDKMKTAGGQYRRTGVASSALASRLQCTPA